MQPSESSRIVEQLKPHQQESGIVTRAEMQLAARWLDAASQGAMEARVDGWLGSQLPFGFRYGGENGRAALASWQRVDGSPVRDGQVERREVAWTDPDTGLRVAWDLRVFPDFPAVEWVLRFENTGKADTPILDEFAALDLLIRRVSVEKPFVVHGAHGGRSLPDDFTPFHCPLPDAEGGDALKIGEAWGEPKRHPIVPQDYSSNAHLPLFNVESPDGRGIAVGVGWSGRWVADLSCNGDALRTRVGFQVARFRLRPGESARLPRVLVLFWEGRPLHGQNMLRALLHRHVVPRLKGKPQEPLASVNVCFTYHGKGGFLANRVTEDKVVPLIDPFAQLGAEFFVIDAGWWECGGNWLKGIGDYRVSKTAYPRGLRPISDPLAKAGVPFSLWFPCELIEPSLPFAQERPDLTHPIQWELPLRRLRLENPEARRYVLDAVDRLVKDEGLSGYRQDFHAVFSDPDPDRQGIDEIHHITGLYAFWDELRASHPEFVMEGCSGGGRRIDLETLSRFHWHQKSDRWYDTVSDQCGLFGANLFLPGGLIDVPTERTDDYGAWSSFAGQFLMGWHPLDADFPFEQARLQIERYKRVRGMLCGDFYPLTDCSPTASWLAFQFHRAEQDRGFALVFRRETSDTTPSSFALRLRGLDPSLLYRARFERTGKTQPITGAALTEGVDLPFLEIPGAEMLCYERLR